MLTISLSVCPNWGIKIILSNETVYTFCYSCQSSFTNETISGTISLKLASPVLHKSIKRLVNLVYLINNTQIKLKTVQRAIRVNQVSKFFRSILILVGIWIIIHRTKDNIQLGLMVIGVSIFFFLLVFIIVSHSKKQLGQEQIKCARLQNEKKSMEESIKALTNNL